MIISSWNVNSVRARIENIKSYLLKYKPDILMMQEIKTEDLNFPYDDFSSMDYESHVFGQKSYNGVAIISKGKLKNIRKDLIKDKLKQSRIISAEMEYKKKNIQLINIYTPNGNPVDTEKYDYKKKWLNDLIKQLKNLSKKNQNIIFVPALTGIGAPYWNANCRGAIYGITRNTSHAEIALATLQSAGYQTKDLLLAMGSDWESQEIKNLRVDGGMSASNVTMQFMSDITGLPVARPKILETTALGVAWLAGSYLDMYPDRKEFGKGWYVDKEYFPEMDTDTRNALYARWQAAVKSTLSFSEN